MYFNTMIWNTYAYWTVCSNSMRDGRGCKIGFILFNGIGDVVFVHILEVSVRDENNMKECFKNKKISLITNTVSTIKNNKSSVLS